MSRLNPENTELAKELIGHYPRPKSALIPLLHLAQEQDGHVTDEAMVHIAELVGVTPAEVLGTCSFYEMFKREPVGRYLVNICQGIACTIMGAEDLIGHAEDVLGVKAGGTTADGTITIERAECQAACTEAPCLQVNYRYRYRVTDEDFDDLVAQLRSGALDDEIPPHGTLSRRSFRQHIPSERRNGPALVDESSEPVWIKRHREAAEAQAGDAPGIDIMTDEIPQIVTGRLATYDDSHTIDRYLATGGYDGLRAALDRAPAEVMNEVKEASLLGRGGAGFPAGVKWGFCPADVWPRYLVVNGDESEPGTYKDRMLMERDPHQLIEGILIACYAIGCAQAFLYCRGEMALAHERLGAALNEAYAAGYVGKNILGTDYSIDIALHWGAGAYIVGEETALIESLEGNRGMPRLKPPYFPAAKGLYLQPTVVNNVETLSNLSWIMTEGADAFHALGAETSRGTRLFAVSGHVKNPGVHEVEFGVTTFRDLIYTHCGGIREDRALKAFVPGGASSPWFFEEHLDLPLETKAIGDAGSMLGSGAIVVMDETTDLVKASRSLVRFFAAESCGKCTPCREGTTWMERILDRIIDGQGRPEDVDLLLDVCDNISPDLTWPPKQTTICPLGPSAPPSVASVVRRFPEEFERYLGTSFPVTVEMKGAAYLPKPTAAPAGGAPS